MYNAPTITALGSVRDLTLDLNKVGNTPDALSGVPVPNGPVVGSFVPTP